MGRTSSRDGSRNNAKDDGQELTNLSFAKDGRTIVYVRGGDHGATRPGDAPNPAASPTAPKMQVWAVATTGGPARLLGDGDSPAVSPDSTRVAFTQDRKIFLAPIDGSKKAEAAFALRGTSGSPAWSPEGRTLAFVSNRGDHSFIALWTLGERRGSTTSTRRPSTTASRSGRWTAGRSPSCVSPAPVARREIRSRSPSRRGRIRVADVSGTDSTADVPASRVVEVANSGDPIDPITRDPVGLNVQWAADDTLIYFSYRDGWQHLYAIHHPGKDSKPLLLTPGAFMAEQVTFTPDRRTIIYNANGSKEGGKDGGKDGEKTPGDAADIDRRHLFKVPINAATPTALTSGRGIEWNPVVTGDGQSSRVHQRRGAAPADSRGRAGRRRSTPPDRRRPHPGRLPTGKLVTAGGGDFRASDGVEVHAQMFRAPGRRTRGPAIVYVHGGGPRQMLLGWHYRWEYANDYAINQFTSRRTASSSCR